MELCGLWRSDHIEISLIKQGVSYYMSRKPRYELEFLYIKQ